eukprot:XP_001705628.1 Hypothetical protein GL50803_10475 [Giardia lamblia ATCC 50803]
MMRMRLLLLVSWWCGNAGVGESRDSFQFVVRKPHEFSSLP